MVLVFTKAHDITSQSVYIWGHTHMTVRMKEIAELPTLVVLFIE